LDGHGWSICKRGLSRDLAAGLGGDYQWCTWG
jgi:hypothetical protein